MRGYVGAWVRDGMGAVQGGGKEVEWVGTGWKREVLDEDVMAGGTAAVCVLRMYVPTRRDDYAPSWL